MSTQDQLVIVDPAAETATASMSIAPRLASLSGVRVGFVDNSKHMAQQMLNAVQEILKTEYGVSDFDYFRKKNASIPIPPDVVAKMATHCDAIVHGVGD